MRDLNAFFLILQVCDPDFHGGELSFDGNREPEARAVIRLLSAMANSSFET